MTITMSGMEEAISNLQALKDSFPDNVDAMMDAAMQVGVGVARDLTPVITGRLRDGNDYAKQDNGTYVLFNDVPYAPFVVFGTRYQAANDFMTPAMQAIADAMTQSAASVLSS